MDAYKYLAGKRTAREDVPPLEARAASLAALATGPERERRSAEPRRSATPGITARHFPQNLWKTLWTNALEGPL